MSAAHFGCGLSLFIPAITVLNEKRDKGLEIKEHPCGSRAKWRTRLKETNEPFFFFFDIQMNPSLSFTRLEQIKIIIGPNM
jgi:hypothetical protein